MSSKQINYLGWQNIYNKLREISEVYLNERYDYIFYIVRGGMTPAHILSHSLNCKETTFYPLHIKRHLEDNIQSHTITPFLRDPIQADLQDKNVLIVEDTIGSGETLYCALQAIQNCSPNSIDIVSCAIDHNDRLKVDLKHIEVFLGKAFIGFDYWGWLVFPWESHYDKFRKSKKLVLNSSGNFAALNQDHLVFPAIQKKYGNTSSFLDKFSLKEEAVNFLLKIVSSYDCPENTIVDICVATPQGKALLSQPKQANYYILQMEKGFNFASFSDESIDLFIIRGYLACKMDLSQWRALLERVYKSLKIGGEIVVDYLDRLKVKNHQDLVINMEYYTPYLINRLMGKIGFRQHENQNFNGIHSFYKGVKVKL